MKVMKLKSIMKDCGELLIEQVSATLILFSKMQFWFLVCVLERSYNLNQ
jgi:hypothetical protein